MRLSDFEAIIFDSDGVLVDSEIIHISVEREMLAELGLNYDQATYLSRFVGLSNPDFHKALEADYSQQVGGEFPSDFSSQLYARVWPRIEAELTAIEGAQQLASSFDGQVAVGSSAPYPRLVRKLEIAGLASVFAPHIYSVDHVRNGKPAPDLFLHAAAQLGVLAARCVVIEDSVHGIRAARAAGMGAIGFVGGRHVDPGLAKRLEASGAHLIAASHAEIMALL